MTKKRIAELARDLTEKDLIELARKALGPGERLTKERRSECRDLAQAEMERFLRKRRKP